MVRRKRHSVTPEYIHTVALTYSSRSKFVEEQAYLYQRAKKFGIYQDVVKHMVNEKRVRDDSEIFAIAKLFKTRWEFQTSEKGVYQTARKRGILKDVCSHMGEPLVDNIKTVELSEVPNIALKYKTRSSFQKSNQPAYTAATRAGILDDVCSHMERGAWSDMDVIYIWRAMGHKYNGFNVYKIGITSARLGHTRMVKVAKDIDVEPIVIIFSQLSCNAHKVEKLLLQLGYDPKYINHDGCTEFRAYSSDDLINAIGIVSRYSVQGRET